MKHNHYNNLYLNDFINKQIMMESKRYMVNESLGDLFSGLHTIYNTGKTIGKTASPYVTNGVNWARGKFKDANGIINKAYNEFKNTQQEHAILVALNKTNKDVNTQKGIQNKPIDYSIKANFDKLLDDADSYFQNPEPECHNEFVKLVSQKCPEFSQYGDDTELDNNGHSEAISFFLRSVDSKIKKQFYEGIKYAVETLNQTQSTKGTLQIEVYGIQSENNNGIIVYDVNQHINPIDLYKKISANNKNKINGSLSKTSKEFLKSTEMSNGINMTLQYINKQLIQFHMNLIVEWDDNKPNHMQLIPYDKKQDYSKAGYNGGKLIDTNINNEKGILNFIRNHKGVTTFGVLSALALAYYCNNKMDEYDNQQSSQQFYNMQNASEQQRDSVFRQKVQNLSSITPISPDSLQSFMTTLCYNAQLNESQTKQLTHEVSVMYQHNDSVWVMVNNKNKQLNQQQFSLALMCNKITILTPENQNPKLSMKDEDYNLLTENNNNQ